MFEGMVFYVNNPPRVCKVVNKKSFSTYNCITHNGDEFVASKRNLATCSMQEKEGEGNTIDSFTVLGMTTKEALNRYPEFFYEITKLRGRVG